MELLATHYFRNLRQPDLLQDVQVYFVCGETRSAAIELVSQQLTLQIKLHIFSSPFYRIFTNLSKSEDKLKRGTRRVCPFKDSFIVFPLNVGSCPSAIVGLFPNVSH